MKEIKIQIPDGYEFDKETMSIVPIKDTFKYVDLGLPSGTLWATCNVGANAPEEQIDELIDSTNKIWCKINDVNGYLFIGKNGNSIFLPAAGCRLVTSLYCAGSYGNYWSSSLGESGSGRAWSVYFYSDGVSRGSSYRYYGRGVRPVLNINK